MFSRVLYKSSRPSQIPSIQSSVHYLIRSINNLSVSERGFKQPNVILPLFVNPHVWQVNNPVKLPTISNKVFNLPTLKYVPNIVDPNLDREIEDPPVTQSNITIEAARLIVIRRKKMKKHKLRKLRKRMKYEWAKLRQKRELKKEKAFQAVLIQRCKDAEEFSAEKYVEEKLEKFNYVRVPKRWKGKLLPEAEIRKKMEMIGLDPS